MGSHDPFNRTVWPTVAYNLMSSVAYIYLTIHDWTHANGWHWIAIQLYNVLRASPWPIYLALTLYWFHGGIPPDRI
jgi:hypothetical protein